MARKQEYFCEDVLAYIKKFMIENGVTPSAREISDGIGSKSLPTVHKRFRELVQLGEIIPYGEATKRYTVKGMRYIDTSEDK